MGAYGDHLIGVGDALARVSRFGEHRNALLAQQALLFDCVCMLQRLGKDVQRILDASVPLLAELPRQPHRGVDWSVLHPPFAHRVVSM